MKIGGYAIGPPQGSTPRDCPCTSAHAVGRKPEAGAGVNHWRCSTEGAACTGTFALRSEGELRSSGSTRPTMRCCMSGVVQVFGCRDAETILTLGEPASEKRQGRKSRDVGHRRCSGRYGDLTPASVLGKLSRRWRSDRFSWNAGRACWREQADRTLLDRIFGAITGQSC